MSLPFSYAVGPVARDREAVLALMEHAHALAKGEGRSLEIKSLAQDVPLAPGYSRREAYCDVPRRHDRRRDRRLRAPACRQHPPQHQEGAEEQPASCRPRRVAESWLDFAKLQEATSHSHGLPAPPRKLLRATAVAAWRSRGSPAFAWPASTACRWPVSSSGRAPGSGSTPSAPRVPMPSRRDPTTCSSGGPSWTPIEAGVGFDLGRASPQQEGPGRVQAALGRAGCATGLRLLAGTPGTQHAAPRPRRARAPGPRLVAPPGARGSSRFRPVPLHGLT